MTRLVIVGAGGHAAVVAEAAELEGTWGDICFVDDKYPGLSESIGLPVVGDLSAVPELQAGQAKFVIAIGDNRTRLEIHQKIVSAGGQLVSIVHPAATVSRTAIVQPGSVILAQAAINARTTIGAACIVNTGSIIDHDCVIASGVHISPGANLAGGVSVGERAWIGIGASVINNVSIGSNAIVGAAAVVLGDVAADQTVVGIPAREIVRR